MDVTNNTWAGANLGNVVMAMVCGGAHCLEIYLLEMFYCLVKENIKTEPISNIAKSRTHEAVDLSRSQSAHHQAASSGGSDKAEME